MITASHHHMTTPPRKRPEHETKIRRLRASLRTALEQVERLDRDLPLQPLPSVAFAVDELLGGTAKTARLCEVSMQTVSDWKRDDFFATNTYELLRHRIIAQGYEAPPRFWRMKEQAAGDVQSSNDDE